MDLKGKIYKFDTVFQAIELIFIVMNTGLQLKLMNQVIIIEVLNNNNRSIRKRT